MPTEATAKDLGFKQTYSLSKNKELIVGKKQFIVSWPRQDFSTYSRMESSLLKL